MMFDPDQLDAAFTTLDDLTRQRRREVLLETADKLNCAIESLAVICARPGCDIALVLSLALNDGEDPLLDANGKAVPFVVALPRAMAHRVVEHELPSLVSSVRETPTSTVCCVLVLDDDLGRVLYDEVDVVDVDGDYLDGPDDPRLELYVPAIYQGYDEEPDDEPDDW
jgi:hypothetical protein